MNNEESLSPIDKILFAYANTDTHTLKMMIEPESNSLEQILLREVLSKRFNAVYHLINRK